MEVFYTAHAASRAAAERSVDSSRHDVALDAGAFDTLKALSAQAGPADLLNLVRQCKAAAAAGQRGDALESACLQGVTPGWLGQRAGLVAAGRDLAADVQGRLDERGTGAAVAGLTVMESALERARRGAVHAEGRVVAAWSGL